MLDTADIATAYINGEEKNSTVVNLKQAFLNQVKIILPTKDCSEKCVLQYKLENSEQRSRCCFSSAFANATITARILCPGLGSDIQKGYCQLFRKEE